MVLSLWVSKWGKGSSVFVKLYFWSSTCMKILHSLLHFELMKSDVWGRKWQWKAFTSQPQCYVRAQVDCYKEDKGVELFYLNIESPRTRSRTLAYPALGEADVPWPLNAPENNKIISRTQCSIIFEHDAGMHGHSSPSLCSSFFLNTPLLEWV